VAGWRIVVSPIIPLDSPSCYDSQVPALAWLPLVRNGAGFPNRRTKLPRNSCFLSGRGSDDLESQLGGFPFELLDL
jgi:hypothetical protein